MNTSTKPAALILSGCLALFATPLAFAGSDVDEHFTKMDADGNGKVTRAEHAAAAKQMFTECDANHDGTVTAAEMDAAMAAKGKKHDKHEKTAADKIKMIDQNGDGQLTATEHEAGSDQMFATMDKDSDGTLSKEECRDAMKMKKKDK